MNLKTTDHAKGHGILIVMSAITVIEQLTQGSRIIEGTCIWVQGRNEPHFVSAPFHHVAEMLALSQG